MQNDRPLNQTIEPNSRYPVHCLKTWPEYFDAVREGRKPFEVRRADRDFRVGDLLLLQRWEPERENYTRDEAGLIETIARLVTYILPGGEFGIERGFVVMGVQDVR